MSSGDIQHRIELYAIRPLLRSLGIPVQRVVLSDRPDAVITDFCGRRVGVEVMECRPSSIVSKGRNSKAQARNLVDFACRQYEKILAERGYEHIRAHINFKDKAYRVDRSINRLQFVDSILDEIERHRRNDRYEWRRRQLSREEIDKLLWNLLSDLLNDRQKKDKITNLLAKLKRQGKIRNESQGPNSDWFNV